ncbi:MAG: hypothetical protein HY290_07205 [Planctomycetia bacterium]|nr:hypothetical protein [Planctomycetia bacterium]
MASLISALLLFGVSAVADDKQETLKQIESHFAEVPAEFNRYRDVTSFGETLSGTKLPQAAIDEEVRLSEAVRAAGLVKDPPEQVFWLCQNALIFAPRAGEQLLKELAEGATTPASIRHCNILCLTAGKSGERVAVGQLNSKTVETRKAWSGYLQSHVILEESAEPIMQAFQREDDTDVKSNLLMALGLLSGEPARRFLQNQARTAADDAVQAAALFGWVESAGFSGIEFLEGIKPVGSKAEKEKAAGLKYLREETSAKSPNGFEVSNDAEFVARFGDLKRSPVIAWLEKKGMLEDDKVRNPGKLDWAGKDELLTLLIDSKAFGLEAVKGALFQSVNAADFDRLIALRTTAWYSPNTYSRARTNTTTILIRHAGRTPASVGDRLSKRMSVKFHREFLFKAVEFVSLETGVPINIDGPGLKMVGVTQNQYQNFALEDVPATMVLRKMLSDYQLVLVVDEDAGIATVTSKAAAAAKKQKAFPLDPAPQK